MESLTWPSLSIMVTPLATPMIKATESRLRAPSIKRWVNSFSLIRPIIATNMAEPKTRADISSVHQPRKTTPAIIIKNVATKMNNSNLVRQSSFVAASELSTSTSNGDLTSPSTWYTSDALGFFFILAAYLKIYQTSNAVITTHSAIRMVRPSIQFTPAALEAMIVENGFENDATVP